MRATRVATRRESTRVHHGDLWYTETMEPYPLDTQAAVVNVPTGLLQRMAEAREQVYQRMLRTRRALEDAGIDFAVVGGNAVAIWVESIDPGAGRNTKDVDILLARTDLPKAEQAMDHAGFDRVDIHGVTMFLDRDDPAPSRGVHVIYVGQKVRPHYQHPPPAIGNILRSGDGVPAIGLVELLNMKLQSFRPIDQAHVIDLINVGLITDDVAKQLPADLRERLEEIRQNPDGGHTTP